VWIAENSVHTVVNAATDEFVVQTIVECCYYTISHVRYCVVQYCIQWSVIRSQSNGEAGIQWRFIKRDIQSKKKKTIQNWVNYRELRVKPWWQYLQPAFQCTWATIVTHLVMLASLLLVWVWTRNILVISMA